MWKKPWQRSANFKGPMEIYPLRFEPIFKERLWGGRKLREVLGKKISGDNLGESWEISGVEGNNSVVSNGPYAGRSITELLEAEPEALLGKGVYARFGKAFPILIKFIDARLDLSIQLHPDDALAQKRHDSFGKTEMWYIMDADPGSRLIVGFNRDVSPEEYQQALEDGRITDLLHYQEVAPGEGYFINSGRIHAIGAGVLLAEIQQSSDITYRVYDFDRKDAGGNLRELHTELALDAMDFQKTEDFEIAYARDPNQENTMVSCPYFTTKYLNLNRDTTLDLSSRDAFTAFIGISGTATIRCGSGQEQIRMGQTLLLPAAANRVEVQSGGCELLEVSI